MTELLKILRSSWNLLVIVVAIFGFIIFFGLLFSGTFGFFRIRAFIKKFMSLKERMVQRFLKFFPDWITPNHLSLARVLSIIFIIPPIITEHFLTAFIVVLLSCLLDFIDGPLARSRNQESEFGKLLDPVADKIVFLGTLIILVYTVQPELIPRSLMWTFIVLEFISASFAVGRKILLSFWQGEIELGANIFGKIKFPFESAAVLVFLLNPRNPDYQLVASYFLKIALFFLILSISYHVISTIRGIRPFQQ